MVVENLIFNIKRQGEAGAGSMNRLSGSLRGLRRASEDAGKGTNKLLASLKRIALYRVLRTVIKTISDQFKDGLKHVYAWSQTIGSVISQTLDTLSGLGLQMQNQLGAALGELLVTVQPVLEALIRLVTRVADAVSQLFAVLGGRTTYHKATASTKQWADAAGGAAKAAKEWKNQLMGFDEINRLEAPADTTGGAGAGNANNIGNFELSPVTMDFSWLEKYKDATMEWLKKLDFGPITKAWERLKSVVLDFAGIVDGALFWAYKNVMLPLATWVIEDAAPASIEFFAGALDVLNAALEKLGPVFQWLLENWIKPLAEWLGNEFTFILQRLGEIFTELADVIRGNTSFQEFWDSLSGAEQTLMVIIGLFGALAIAVFAVNHPILAIIAVLSALAYAFDISLQDVVNWIYGAIDAVKEKVAEWKEAWDEHVERMNEKTEECRQKIEVFKQKFHETVENIKNKINEWKEKWNDHVNRMNEKTEECREKIDHFKQRFNEAVQNIKNTLSSWRDAVRSVTDAIGGFFDGLRDKIGGIAEGIVEKIGNIIEKARQALRAIRNLWNDDEPQPSQPGDTGGSTSGGGSSRFATGGFPEDGLFFANSGELVGQFSNGRTAVANNEEIISGISRGVYNAVVNAFASGGGNNRSGNGVVMNVNGREFMRAIWDDINAVKTEHGISLVTNG